MPLLFVVLALTLVVIEPVAQFGKLLNSEADVSEATALGSSLLVVRNALAAYMRSYPVASGQVPLSALGLPNWLRPDPAIRTLITSGRGYVYYTPTKPLADLTTLLGSRPTGLIGIAANARLISAGSVSTIPLPTSIPDKSIVLIN